MVNGSCLINENEDIFDLNKTNKFYCKIPGVKEKQIRHTFGRLNYERRKESTVTNDEIDLIEQCFARIKLLGSDKADFFRSLDREAWDLIQSWRKATFRLNSRRCLLAGLINGTGCDLQIVSTKLIEGGSPCYHLPSKEFDEEQSVLNPGGAILFFAWGSVPNLFRSGRVLVNIETPFFICNLCGQKKQKSSATAHPGYKLEILEKSYDTHEWWAKYWMLVRKL